MFYSCHDVATFMYDLIQSVLRTRQHEQEESKCGYQLVLL